MAKKCRKVIFVLGAGFSIPAGLPAQAGLLKAALSGLENDPELTKCQQRLFDFVEGIYGLTREEAVELDLEDIYTPLHQAIGKNEFLKTNSPAQLKAVENDLNRLISHTLEEAKPSTPTPVSYVQEFVDRLCGVKISARTGDQFAILSLNWDILLDKQLFQTIDSRGSLDYCCHCTGIDRDNRIMPGILARGQKKYSIKLLKLHGSLNWLTCPQCHRLFINRQEKIGLMGFTGSVECRFCKGVILGPAILLPSFRKNLESFHFQHIWNQAAVEISEASRIVFIGYSFPLADYDFRAMLTKHMPPNVRIDAVLYSSDGMPTSTGKAYQRFFGKKIDTVYYSGVENYVRNHLPFP